MFHASKFVGVMDSDSDDYVSVDEEEIETGIQTVNDIVNDKEMEEEETQDLFENDDSSEDSDEYDDDNDEELIVEDQPITLLGFMDNRNNNNINNKVISKSLNKEEKEVKVPKNNNKKRRIRKNKKESNKHINSRYAPRKPQLQQRQQIRQTKTAPQSKSVFSNLFGRFSSNKTNTNTNNNSNNNNRRGNKNKHLSSSPVYELNDDGWNWSGNNNNVMSESMVQHKVNSIQTIFKNKKRSKRNNKNNNKKNKLLARKKINTNVVALDLATLGDKATIATGDSYKCKNTKCKAVLSSHDKLLTTDGDFKCDDDEKIWNCQFCNTRNIIDIEEEEAPKNETMDYILSPPSDEKSQEEGLIVFCVDISGSMCVTQAVEGKFKLKGKEDLSSIENFNEDRSNQWLPNQKKNTTYISRLQAVQASIDDQLDNLFKTKPKTKICLVTFSSEVTVIGDGTQKSEFIVGDKLKNEKLLKEIGNNYKIENTIEKSKDKLTEKLYSLRENGQTALGPALVVSIALASQKAGSQVILCTDGVANVGLGDLDDLTEEQQNKCLEWYESQGNEALSKGVTVNVISITDREARLENLGKVCDLSQGTVERINPLELQSNFKGILEKKILATKCQATMIVHPVLKFRTDEDDEISLDVLKKEEKKELPKQLPKQLQRQQLSVVKEEPTVIEKDNKEDNKDNKDNKEDNKDKKDDKSDNNTKKEDKEDIKVEIVKKEEKEEKKEDKEEETKEEATIDRQIQDIGNVFDNTKIYFEYTINKKLLKEKYINLKEFVFQVQILYNRSDGSKMLRTITQKKIITKDRKKLLNSINMGIMAANASRKTGRMVEDGDYESARAFTYMNSVWMSNNLQNKKQMNAMNNYISSNMQMDNIVQQQQQQEQLSTKSQGLFKMNKRKKKNLRSQQRQDQFSEVMYSSKKM